jgi:hypothetical protein
VERRVVFGATLGLARVLAIDSGPCNDSGLCAARVGSNDAPPCEVDASVDVTTLERHTKTVYVGVKGALSANFDLAFEACTRLAGASGVYNRSGSNRGIVFRGKSVEATRVLRPYPRYPPSRVGDETRRAVL